MNADMDISGIILETERLTLRPWRETDLKDFYAYASIDGVGQMAGWNPHKSMEESRQILELFIAGKHTFALEYRGRVIGSLGIDEYPEDMYPELQDLRGRELGYVLSKELWGQGLMPEAVKAVIDYLFNRVSLDFILVGHFDWNRQSERVIQKCGFHYIKTIPYQTFRGTIETSEESILYRPHFMDGVPYENDTDLVQQIYSRFDENTRLTGSRAGQVEFITNTRYIEKYLKPGARILDVGAGTGEYSLYFGRKGYEVTAVELADRNIRVFRQKLLPSDSVKLLQGNALDLSYLPDQSFDDVLLFGPLYHLHRREDQLRCIAEAKRVCRPGGTLFFAFISNDMVILNMFHHKPDYFLTDNYDHESLRLRDFPFVFHTAAAARQLLADSELSILHEVGSDGISELLKDQINAMDEESYGQYLKYHAYACEKPGHLELSSHLLFVCK